MPGTVILAAGAYGSAAMLLRSGIEQERELRAHGIRVHNAVPAVGELSDHCRVGLGFALRDEAAAALATDGGDRTIAAPAARQVALVARRRRPLGRPRLRDRPARPLASADHGRTEVAPARAEACGLRSADPAHLPRVNHGLL